MKKISLRLALLMGVVAFPNIAEAIPVLGVRAFDLTGNVAPSAANQITMTPSTSSFGFISSFGTNGDFPVVSVTSSGSVFANGGLSTTTLDISGVAGSILRLIIGQNGLTSPGATQPFELTYTLNSLTAGSGGGSATFSTYLDPGNTLFGTAQQLGTAQTRASTTGTYDATFLGTGLTPGGLYDETQVIDITFLRTGSITASAQIVPVPEPGTLTVLGASLVGLGLMRRRARQ